MGILEPLLVRYMGSLIYFIFFSEFLQVLHALCIAFLDLVPAMPPLTVVCLPHWMHFSLV